MPLALAKIELATLKGFDRGRIGKRFADLGRGDAGKLTHELGAACPHFCCKLGIWSAKNKKGEEAANSCP